MSIDKLLYKINSLANRTAVVIGLPLVLAGCCSRSVDFNRIYNSHKVSIGELESHPGNYHRRMLRTEGLFYEDADVDKSDKDYHFLLKAPADNANQSLLCSMRSDPCKSSTTDTGLSIIQKAKKANEQGVMYTLSLDGVLRGDKSTSYWLDVHRMKELDSNRYVTVGLTPSGRGCSDRGYREWTKEDDEKFQRRNAQKQ